LHATRKRKNILGVQAVIIGGSRGKPRVAVFDGLASVLADEGGGIRIARIAANVFKAPVKGLHAAIVVGGPAAVFVATNLTFKPVHSSVYRFASLRPTARGFARGCDFKGALWNEELRGLGFAIGAGNEQVFANEKVTNKSLQEPRSTSSSLRKRAVPPQNGGGVRMRSPEWC
jgi:hypothetical protein